MERRIACALPLFIKPLNDNIRFKLYTPKVHFCKFHDTHYILFTS